MKIGNVQQKISSRRIQKNNEDDADDNDDQQTGEQGMPSIGESHSQLDIPPTQKSPVQSFSPPPPQKKKKKK